MAERSPIKTKPDLRSIIIANAFSYMPSLRYRVAAYVENRHGRLF